MGLVYSPRNRDLLDSGSDDLYDVEDSTHFAAYRTTARLLYRAHVPFDVVLDTDTAAFSRYAVLILPEVWAMSAATAATLHAFPGQLITIGDTGWYDEWLNERDENALAGVAQTHIVRLGAAGRAALLAAADTDLLTTTAPATVQMELRQDAAGTSAGLRPALSLAEVPGLHLVLVNLNLGAPAAPFDLTLRLPAGASVTAVTLSAPGGPDGQAVIFSQGDNRLTINVPAVTDIALLKVVLDSDRYYDLTGDGLVGVADILAVTRLWRTEAGQPAFNAGWDFDGNFRIDVVDVMLIAAHWGEAV